MELLPSLPMILIGGLLAGGRVGLVVAIIMAVFLVTMLITVFGVREEPLREKPVGNLRDVGYDFKRVWFSPEADRLRASIHRGECACPMANAGYTNMLLHPPTLARVVGSLIR